MNGMRKAAAMAVGTLGLVLAFDGAAQAHGLVLRTFAFGSTSEEPKAYAMACQFLSLYERPAHLAGPFSAASCAPGAGTWQIHLGASNEMRPRPVVVVMPASSWIGHRPHHHGLVTRPPCHPSPRTLTVGGPARPMGCPVRSR